MKFLPTLYSRTNTGAIQQWTAQIDGNKYRFEYGQTDGEKVLTEWTVCKPKNVGRANATTAEEQALSEAQNKWDKKAKTGYTPDIKKIDSCTSYVEPMLAKDFEEYVAKLNFTGGLFVQNKYNGVRCVATFDGSKVVLKSRKGELWLAVPHINADLEKLFKKNPDAVLDGELYNYDLRQKLNELSGLARKQKAKELTPELFAKTEDMVRFYVYDGYDFEGMDQSVPYRQRKAWIDENLPKYTKYCRKVPTHTVKSVAELETIYQSYLADGEEGAIIRLPESAYENKRSKNLLKYKPEYDDECEILKVLPGDKGKAQYLASKATIKWKDKVFEATFMGTEEVRTQILKEKHKWEGKKNVTFKHIGLSGKGVPNSARIDPDNCFKGDR